MGTQGRLSLEETNMLAPTHGRGGGSIARLDCGGSGQAGVRVGPVRALSQYGDAVKRLTLEKGK